MTDAIHFCCHTIVAGQRKWDLLGRSGWNGFIEQTSCVFSSLSLWMITVCSMIIIPTLNLLISSFKLLNTHHSNIDLWLSYNGYCLILFCIFCLCVYLIYVKYLLNSLYLGEASTAYYVYIKCSTICNVWQLFWDFFYFTPNVVKYISWYIFQMCIHP